MIERDLWKPIKSNLPHWSSVVCTGKHPGSFDYHQRRRTHKLPGQVVPVLYHPQSFFSCADRTFCAPVYAQCSLPCHWAALKKRPPHPVDTHPLDILKVLTRSPLSPLFSKLDSPRSQPSVMRKMLQTPSHLCNLPATVVWLLLSQKKYTWIQAARSIWSNLKEIQYEI